MRCEPRESSRAKNRGRCIPTMRGRTTVSQRNHIVQDNHRSWPLDKQTCLRLRCRLHAWEPDKQKGTCHPQTSRL